ncbi:MAG: DUF4058 family protein [Chloroflexota bacterium]|nr:DUF4058 family protein [Chloroflexota bacterium]
MYSQQYADHLKKGAFPDRIDPWAEAPRYFQQIHANMIGNLQQVLNDELERRGYTVGREVSLQVLENREPDLHIYKRPVSNDAQPRWDFLSVSESIVSRPLRVIDDFTDRFDSLKIYEMTTGDLVTIVEVISPGNKLDVGEIAAYRERRRDNLNKSVYIVELDITRSIKRMVKSVTADIYPYHAAFHLYDQPSCITGVEFDQPLGRIAIPLRSEAVGVNLSTIYCNAYEHARIASQIYNDSNYEYSALPFPSVMTAPQRETIMNLAQIWSARLQELKSLE